MKNDALLIMYIIKHMDDIIKFNDIEFLHDSIIFDKIHDIFDIIIIKNDKIMIKNRHICSKTP